MWLLTRMTSHMHRQRVRSSEGHVTHFTSEWFLSGMDPFMVHHVPLLCEGPAAVLAGVLPPLTEVDDAVAFQLVATLEATGTLVAAVRQLLAVHPLQMPFYLDLAREALAAVLALERLLLRVGRHVLVQVDLLGEGPAALPTDEWLLTRVDSHVLFQSEGLCERGRAIRTLECLAGASPLVQIVWSCIRVMLVNKVMRTFGCYNHILNPTTSLTGWHGLGYIGNFETGI